MHWTFDRGERNYSAAVEQPVPTADDAVSQFLLGIDELVGFKGGSLAGLYNFFVALDIDGLANFQAEAVERRHGIGPEFLTDPSSPEGQALRAKVLAILGPGQAAWDLMLRRFTKLASSDMPLYADGTPYTKARGPAGDGKQPRTRWRNGAGKTVRSRDIAEAKGAFPGFEQAYASNVVNQHRDHQDTDTPAKVSGAFLCAVC